MSPIPENIETCQIDKYSDLSCENKCGKNKHNLCRIHYNFYRCSYFEHDFEDDRCTNIVDISNQNSFRCKTCIDKTQHKICQYCNCMKKARNPYSGASTRCEEHFNTLFVDNFNYN